MENGVLFNRGIFKKINKNINTLRVWDGKNILKPHHLTAGGHRMYSED
ncbi:DNA-binding transcriptional MerR regulator [Bacillus fengqiuensis]|nr:DNA-binding transcriptional MerR regulator [Bacillus fengqiuensis]